MDSEVIALHEVGKLILEARINDIKAKYPLKLHDKIDILSEKDPSSNNKYLEWLAKQTLRATLQELRGIDGGGYLNPEGDDLMDNYYSRQYADWSIRENEKRILFDNIDYFHNYIRKFEKRDINQYNNWRNFNEEVEKAKLKLSRKEIKQSGVIKIFEDDDFLLLTPLTHQAACRYGSNTRWCVSMRGYSGYFENYFTQGPIFFLMDKRMIPPTRSMQTEDYYKLAMHYRPRWENQRGRWGPSWSYLSDNKDAGKMANKLTKEEFVGGADKDKAVIDFWTTSDKQVQKSVAQKYMGGPGRGQKIRGQEFIGRFEDIMERYTKKILSDFYDNISVDENKIRKLSDLKSELKLKSNYLDDYLIYSKNQLDRMINNVDRYKDNVSNQHETLPPGISPDDLDLESTDWINSIKTSIEERRASFKLRVDSMEEEIVDRKDKISKIEKEVELQFQFYDIEKSIQQKN